jgi:hypothetical protein
LNPESHKNEESNVTKKQPLRVIQWATGSVGRYAIDAMTDDPNLELVGVWVHSESKDGQDAGTIAGIDPLGVKATRDKEALLALPADCVLYAPLLSDVDEICRILESGKNVVTPTGFSYVKDPTLAARLDAACRKGNVSFHGSGIHPGFAGDRLPLATRSRSTKSSSSPRPARAPRCSWGSWASACRPRTPPRSLPP